MSIFLPGWTPRGTLDVGHPSPPKKRQTGAHVINCVCQQIFVSPDKEDFYIDNPMPLCLRFIARFLGNGFVTIMSINRADRTKPSDMHALLCSFLKSLVKTGLNRAVPLCYWQDSRSFFAGFLHILHGK